ncbi:MAG: TonB-dependent receptor [Gammaproteobacteria bacterium]|nr:TonB-dependent receptor [Gammaproteobacteria bacterium]MDH5304280.1 TonB-dependent receptor [Gammaproteobacteria bacterium]MDH5321546.1 TonB-dependent receptor [Gammaproteobacteria bacterium]
MLFKSENTGGISRPGSTTLAATIATMASLLSFPTSNVFAQDGVNSGDESVEEVVVVGSQIRGATISDALAVSVLTSADIEALGVDSGDELLDMMAEQGSNYFSESENISGGVNSARGDVGAFNLRNLGTGNTLVLLNGRRVVNMASYQTEQVGGSFVPVNSVNSQTLPLAALERVEVLRDGASAIYGADAVAGVVNYVTKKDYEGLSVNVKYAEFEGLPRNDIDFSLEWGRNFNGDRTNITVLFDAYGRDPVNSQDDPKWANSDMTRLVPADSPWLDDFDNNSSHSQYGQYDIISSVSSLGLTGTIWDSAGEFETYPTGDPRCQWDLGYGTCGAVDGQGTYQYNNNVNRDLYSDLERYTTFVFLNHEFENGVSSFTELSGYASRTTTYRHASTKLGAVASHVIAANNYYNPFGPCSSPNRLDASIIGTGVPCTGVAMTFDFYRWAQVPRVVDNHGDDFRFLTGLRGSWGEWDWEGAVSWSRSEKADITYNRVSNSLLQQGLNDTTAAAINPFAGDLEGSNLERALITVRRDNETELGTVDFKVSHNELFNLPAGPVGVLGGVEFRTESFVDDRDPRLDGTIVFTDTAGSTFPDISDVMNSSPSADSKGDRDVVSAFAELQVPVFSNLDLQLALRYEDYSDVGDATVGKVAFGWRVIDQLLIRGSWSEALRVPNLVTVNEGDFTRSNSNDDYVCLFVDPNQDTFDCNYPMLRAAGGSDDLVPEESDNTSVGIVVDANEHLTLTLDYWSIEKQDTIGLFGEANHTALGLLSLIEAGVSNCANPAGNPRVERLPASTLEPDELALFAAAGICPVGEVTIVNDSYANLDVRKVKGHDIGVYFNYDTPIGEIDLRYVAAFLDEYDQVPGPEATALFEAQEAGILPANVSIEGFGNLIRADANPRQKQTARLSWRRGDWGAAISGLYISDFIDTGATLDDGTKYVIPSMTTFNASADYNFEAFGDIDARVRLGMNNVFDERAPLADESFGYWGDVHRDIGRSYYIDVRLDF